MRCRCALKKRYKKSPPSGELCNRLIPAEEPGPRANAQTAVWLLPGTPPQLGTAGAVWAHASFFSGKLTLNDSLARGCRAVKRHCIRIALDPGSAAGHERQVSRFQSRSTIRSSVEMSMLPSRLRATGQNCAWNPCTRSAVSRWSGATFNVYVAWIRLIISTLPSFSISASTSAVRKPSPAGILRASSAPPKVPVSQPPVAALT